MNVRKIRKSDVAARKYATYIIDKGNNVTRVLADSESNREYVSYDKIPRKLVKAFVAVEDKKFFKHHGIDILGILRSIFITIYTLGRKTQGGSTITQQLIKNTVFPDWFRKNTFKEKLKRKVQEPFIAHRIERHLSKTEIMENYLNVIYFGNGRYGVQAASKLYFGKDVWKLTLGECALLAGVPLSPATYDPFRYPEKCIARRNLILKKLYDQQKISKKEYETALEEDALVVLSKNKVTLGNFKCYSYYEEALFSQVKRDLARKGISYEKAKSVLFSGGLRVYSNENATLQRYCEKIFRTHEFIPDLTEESGPQSALIVMDSDNGQVIALIGGRGEKTESLLFNRAIDAKRNEHQYAMASFLSRTEYILEKQDGICLLDVCQAYSYYESGCKVKRGLLYSKVLNKKNRTLLNAKAELNTVKNDIEFHLPSPVEITLPRDVWVVGSVGKYVIGVWGGFDDNQLLPVKEEYYTFPRKIFTAVSEMVEKELNYEG